MNFQQALAQSPVKQAIYDDGSGLTAVVAQLPAGDYQVMIAVNERPYLIEIVQDEHAAEQVLWERMRIRNMRFMPVQPGSKPPKLIYVLPTWSQRLTTFFRKFFALRWSK